MPRPTACRAGQTGFDLKKVVERSRGVASQLNRGVTGLMKKHKIAVHMGEGKLAGKGKLTVTADGKTTELQAKHIIVATGARARDLPFAKADGKRIWTYRTRDDPAGNADRAAGHRVGRDRDRVRQFLQRPRRQGDGGRDARPRRAGRGCRGQRLPRQAAQEAGHDLADQGRRREPEGRRQAASRRRSRPRDGKSRRASLQPRHRRGRDRAQHREYRRRGARHEDDQGPYRHRRALPHQRAGRVGDRRRHRAAVACAQGEPRGRHRRRGDRQGAGQQGRASARDGRAEHPRLHLLPAAGRQRRADRGQGQGSRLRGQGRQIPVRRQRQGDRARRGRKASSRRCSTPRPANCSART